MCAELVRCPMHTELARSPSAEQLHTVTATVIVQDVRSLGEIRIVRAEHVSAKMSEGARARTEGTGGEAS